MAIAGCAGGGAWAAIAALLRRWRGVNEVISTLLANYLAILLIDVFVFGPWKNPEGLGYPYTTPFGLAAVFPAIAGSRFHWGFLAPVIALVVTSVILNRTIWDSRCAPWAAIRRRQGGGASRLTDTRLPPWSPVERWPASLAWWRCRESTTTCGREFPTISATWGCWQAGSPDTIPCPLLPPAS